MTAEQGLEGDPGFEPGQRSAEAVMNAMAEPEVATVGGPDTLERRRHDPPHSP